MTVWMNEWINERMTGRMNERLHMNEVIPEDMREETIFRKNKSGCTPDCKPSRRQYMSTSQL